jgi:hypothetical protein
MDGFHQPFSKTVKNSKIVFNLLYKLGNTENLKFFHEIN